MKYRTLGKSGLRVSGAALGYDLWRRVWMGPKDEAQKIYETYREPMETSLRQRILH